MKKINAKNAWKKTISVGANIVFFSGKKLIMKWVKKKKKLNCLGSFIMSSEVSSEVKVLYIKVLWNTD